MNQEELKDSVDGESDNQEPKKNTAKGFPQDYPGFPYHQGYPPKVESLIEDTMIAKYRKLPFYLTILLFLIVQLWLIRFYIKVDAEGFGFFDISWTLWILFGFCLPGITISLSIFVLSTIYLDLYKDIQYAIYMILIFFAFIIWAGAWIVVSTVT